MDRSMIRGMTAIPPGRAILGSVMRLGNVARAVFAGIASRR
jgi:hypothetical protein